MSEFIVTTGVGGGGVAHVEHHTKRLLACDAESAGRRLIPALEKLGYRVLDEQPPLLLLRAKRGGARQFVGKIFESQIELAVTIRPSTANSTHVAFDYALIHAALYKGDHRTIEREVDAVVALAEQLTAAEICAACGTTSGGGAGDSRFCRACGTPHAGGEPAELKLLRLDAGARRGHRMVITGASLAFATLLPALALILFGNPKGVTAGWVLLLIGEIAGWLTFLRGTIISHRALNSAEAASPQRRPLPPNTPPTASALEPAALSARPAHASVTEGTTDLLDRREPEA